MSAIMCSNHLQQHIYAIGTIILERTHIMDDVASLAFPGFRIRLEVI